MAFRSYFADFARQCESLRTVNAILDKGSCKQSAEVRAFFTDVYSVREVDPAGMWRLDVFTGGPKADMRLLFTDEQRRKLVEALGGIVPEWTQEDEDAYIARKSDRDWHLALKPEDV